MQDAGIVQSGKKTGIIHLKQEPVEKCEASVLRHRGADEPGCYITRSIIDVRIFVVVKWCG